MAVTLSTLAPTFALFALLAHDTSPRQGLERAIAFVTGPPSGTTVERAFSGAALEEEHQRDV